MATISLEFANKDFFDKIGDCDANFFELMIFSGYEVAKYFENIDFVYVYYDGIIIHQKFIDAETIEKMFDVYNSDQINYTEANSVLTSNFNFGYTNFDDDRKVTKFGIFKSYKNHLTDEQIANLIHDIQIRFSDSEDEEIKMGVMVYRDSENKLVIDMNVASVTEEYLKTMRGLNA